MRFTLPFLLAIVMLVACVHGANLTAFQSTQASAFDILGAVQSIAFRLTRIVGFAPEAAMIAGAIVLMIPAMFTFHAGRMVLGGSTSRLRAEGRSLTLERSGIAIDALLERDERLRAGLVTDPAANAENADHGVNYMTDANRSTGQQPVGFGNLQHGNGGSHPAAPNRTNSAPANDATARGAQTDRRLSASTPRERSQVGNNRAENSQVENNQARSADAGENTGSEKKSADGGRLERFLGKRPNFSSFGKQASALRARIASRKGAEHTAQAAASAAIAGAPTAAAAGSSGEGSTGAGSSGTPSAQPRPAASGLRPLARTDKNAPGSPFENGTKDAG